MFSFLTSLSLILQPEPAPPPASVPKQAPAAPLTLEQTGDIRCAAAFAIVAGQQQRGVASALAYPTMEPRGRTFFADLGERLVATTGRNREDVRALIVDEVKAFQASAIESKDPNATIDAIMTPCLMRLEAAVPPPPQPSLPQCAAIMALAYDEVFAREGLSSTAKDLKTLATVLESRARAKLREEGNSGNESDIILGTLKAQLADEAVTLEAEGKSPNLDYEYCFELAEP